MNSSPITSAIPQSSPRPSFIQEPFPYHTLFSSTLPTNPPLLKPPASAISSIQEPPPKTPSHSPSPSSPSKSENPSCKLSASGFPPIVVYNLSLPFLPFPSHRSKPPPGIYYPIPAQTPLIEGVRTSPSSSHIPEPSQF